MKTKAIILAVILGIVLFGVSQTTFSQDENPNALNKNLTKQDLTGQAEGTEKVKKLNQEDKKSIAIKIWNYISTNPLLSTLIVALIITLCVPVILRKKDKKNISIPLDLFKQLVSDKASKQGTQPKSQLVGIDEESIKKALEKEPELRKIAKESDIDKLKEDLFETILSSAEGFFYKGNVYYHDGKFKEAIDSYTEAIKLNPKDAQAYANRGVAYAHLKQYERAIYAHLKQYERAIEDFNEAINITPKDAMAYNNRGLAYAYLKEYNKAIEDYNKAIKINPKDANVYFNFACMYALRNEEGDRGRMIEYLKKALALNDKNKKDAKEDKDFKKYWDDPDFKKLVE